MPILLVSTIANFFITAIVSMAAASLFGAWIIFDIFIIFSSFAASIATILTFFKDEVRRVGAIIIVVINGGLFLWMCAYVHQAVGFEMDGKPATEFLDALYFSIVTFTTLGYGDFKPSAELRLIAASQALFGYIYLGLLVGAANKMMNEPSRR